MTDIVITNTSEYLKFTYNDTSDTLESSHYNRNDIKDVQLLSNGQVCMVLSIEAKYLAVSAQAGCDIVESFAGVSTTTNAQLADDLASMIKV